MIEFRAFGTGEIQTPLATITPSHSMVFAAAVYLILEHGRPVSRSRLASLLWPDISESLRSHRLRQTLLQMRKLGIPVDADRTKILLPYSKVRADLDALNDQGPILGSSLEMLAGYNPGFSEDFADWLDSRRQTVHGTVARFLICAINKAKYRADWSAVEEIACQCLALDPLNETAILARAEASAMRGSKREALSILDRFLLELGNVPKEIRLPAEVLRRRIVDRVPEQSARINEQLPFVGREVEAELLNRRLNQVQARSGGIVVVAGDPGIGKSRLAAEFGRFALLQGCEVRQIACRPADVDRPLSLFVDLVPQLRELRGALGCAPATIALLKRLTDLSPPLNEYSRPVDSHAVFGSLRAALFDLLDSIADEQSVVVIVDDVQWLDEVSARLLVQMADWAATKPLLFVLTSRRGPNRFLTDLEASNLPTIPLKPLNPSDSDSLLRSVSQQVGRTIDPEFEEWSLSVAEGNPFFLQELARHWAETGNKHEAPSSVVSVLEARIARLSPDGLRVLQTSAILSELATLDRVRSVLGFQPHQLVAAVEELSGSAMLRAVEQALAAKEGEIQPRHELVAAVAVGQLSPLSLGFLHRRAADVLQAEFGDANDRAALWWACAKHSLLAGDKARALSYSLACAEHLLAMGLAKEASEAFQKSLDYCANDEQRLTVLPRMAFSLQTEAKWDLSKKILHNCIDLSARVTPVSNPHNEFELLLLEAHYRSSFDYVRLFEDFKACVESSEASPSHRIRAGIHALKLATDFGPRESVHSLYRNLGSVIGSDAVPKQDSLELAIVYRSLASEETIPIAHFREFLEAGSPEVLEYFHRLMTIVSSCRLTGRYAEGLSFIGEALTCAGSRNLPTYAAQAYLAEAQLHIAAEDYHSADCALRKTRERLIAVENIRLREEPLYLEARLALELEDSERCKVALSSIAAVSPSYSPSRTSYFFALHVGLRVLAGESTDSLAPHVERLKQAQVRSRFLALQDFETYCLYRGLTALGKREEAEQILRDYVRVHRQCKWPLSKRLARLLEPVSRDHAVTTAQAANEIGLDRAVC